MSESSAPFTQKLHETAQLYFGKFQRQQWVALSLIVLCSIVVAFITLGFIETAWYLPSWFKITTVIVALTAGLAWTWKKYHSWKHLDFETWYRSCADQSSQPELKYAIDEHRYPNKNKLTPLALKQISEQLSSVSVQQTFKIFNRQFSSFNWAFRGSFLSAGLILLFVLLSNTSFIDAQRSLSIWKSFTPPNTFAFSVSPGDVTVEQGDRITIFTKFEGDHPEKLSLHFKTDIENAFRTLPLTPQGDSAYVSQPIQITTDARYYVQMERHLTDTSVVSVQIRPRFDKLLAVVQPPKYTQLPNDTTKYPFDNLSAFPGSELKLEGEINKDVSGIELFWEEKSQRIEGTNRFDISKTISADDSVSITLTDNAGLSGELPVSFTITTREDQYPMISILQPEAVVEIKNPGNLPVLYEMSDDFGIRSATLIYTVKKAFSQESKPNRVRLNKARSDVFFTHEWNLEPLGLTPLDEIRYRIEVVDNDVISGPKKTSSAENLIKIPSMVDMVDQIAEKEEAIDDSFSEVNEDFEEFQKQYEEMIKNLRDNPAEQWREEQNVQDLRQKQQEMEEKVNELNKAFEEIKKELEDNNMLSEETLKKYEELQDLLEQINDSELKDALQKLQESLSQFDQRSLQKSLEDVEFNEQKYQERLNRTLELFKDLKLNTQMEQTSKALDELSKQEQKLSESELSSEAVEQQKSIQKQLDQLREQMEKWSEEAPDSKKKQVEQLEEMMLPKMDQISESLKENAQKMEESLSQENQGEQQSGENSESGEQQQSSPSGQQQQQEQLKQQQQQMSKMMQQMAKDIGEKRQQMSAQQINVNVQALESVLTQVLSLSEKQEEIHNQVKTYTNNSRAFVDQARIQDNIARQFTFVVDSLYALSAEIPAMSNRVNEKKLEVQRRIDRSLSFLSERNPQLSSGEVRMTLGEMNELAAMLTQLLERLDEAQNNSSGQGGMSSEQMMQQLQDMQGDQQQLNQQMQQMINDMQGERLSQDQMQRLNQMSRMQNEIRKQLNELKENGGFESGDKIMSDLQRMSEEMEDAINDMRGGRRDKIMIERQQNILSRMLQAEKALEERGEEEKRKGDTATDFERTNPPPLSLEELRKKIQLQMKGTGTTPYNEDFRKLIEQYFKELQKRMDNASEVQKQPSLN
jgi:hypothetical protein